MTLHNTVGSSWDCLVRKDTNRTNHESVASGWKRSQRIPVDVAEEKELAKDLLGRRNKQQFSGKVQVLDAFFCLYEVCRWNLRQKQ